MKYENVDYFCPENVFVIFKYGIFFKKMNINHLLIYRTVKMKYLEITDLLLQLFNKAKF